MDRLFLDANILVSAAYEPSAHMQVFWKLKDVVLCSSHNAVEEARGNLATEEQKSRLSRLLWKVRVFDAVPRELIGDIRLPEKDVPILLGAIGARATHLITGDLRHFGSYFGERIEGILVITAAGYMKRRK
jgi:predicted nucleic acid-binding protein